MRLRRLLIGLAVGSLGTVLVWAPHWGRSLRMDDGIAQASPTSVSLTTGHAGGLITTHANLSRSPHALAPSRATKMPPSEATPATHLQISSPREPTLSSPPALYRTAPTRLLSRPVSETKLRIVTRRLEPALAGAPYHMVLAARGGAPPYRWSLVEGLLPQGLRLDETQGILYGLPEHLEVTSFTVGVKDATNQQITRRFLLTVLEQQLPLPVEHNMASPLTLLTTTLPNGIVGRPYAVQLQAQGGQPPYTWAASAGTLPDGLSLDRALGVLAGLPTHDGVFSFQVLLRDARRAAFAWDFTLRVTTSPVYLVTGALASGMVNQFYTQPLQAQGGSPPYTWSLVSGALPDGLALHPLGRIEGLPVATGLSVLRLRVEDQHGATDTAELQLAVSGEPLHIVTPTNLPRGIVGEAYEMSLAATGGIPSYRWSRAGGTLPEDITLHEQGTLSGTPQTAGRWSVVIHISDAAQASASTSLILYIDGPVTPPITPVTHLIAVPSDGKVGLAWRNPTLASYDHTIVVRRTDRAPAGPEDGTLAYSGTDTQVVDASLLNGASYYYAAYAIDRQSRPSKAAEDSRAQAMPQAVTIAGGPADPYADAVASFAPLHPNPFGMSSMPTVVLGAPKGLGSGMGSLDVVSLGCGVNTDQGRSAPYGGSITLEFRNNIIVDGPGGDFTVFENVFYIGGNPEQRLMEPAIVAVSQDGQAFYQFPFDYVPHFTPGNQVDFKNPFSYSYGFAGINPVFSNLGSPDPTHPSVSGGESFDLATLPGQPLRWVRFVRISDTGDQWLTDVNGDLVRHINEPLLRACERTASNSGFDLDAVAAVHY